MRDPEVMKPVTMRVKSPREVAPEVTLRIVVVGVPPFCGKETEVASVIAASPGAPLRDKDRVAGNPVVDEPGAKFTVTV